MRRRLLGSLAAVLVLAACSGGSGSSASDVTLTLWSHGGTAGEKAALATIVSRFEAAHPHVTVTVTTIAEGEYDDHLQAAIARGALPDVVDVDGPLVADYASQQALAPLDGVLPAATLRDVLPTLRTQGTWHGRLWALGTFDSGLGIWADRPMLAAAGVRIPTSDQDAWTEAEMRSVLRALAAHDPDRKVLDLREDYGAGEWLTYGFSPLVASAGGDLSQLGSPATLRALTALSSWRSFVDPDADGKAFTSRRVALSWVGHWAYADYSAALGRDLVLLPLPDLGHGSKTGQGSWAWSIAASSPHKAAAADLLAFLDDDASVATMTAANAAVPGTASALAASTLHGTDGPLHLFAEQLDDGAAVPRPVTPTYPTLTAAFAGAVHDVLAGVDPAVAQATAVKSLG